MLVAVHKIDVDLAGRKLTLETGRVAGLADGAVLVTYGETVLLATAVSSPEPREGIDFFPLTVEYEERMYAAGKIPGGFIKREGRPGEQAILSARLTDRPIRPLFPKYYRNDVQVVNLVMSADQLNDPAILSIIGASGALHLSSIPFQGPVAAVKMGYIDGKLVVNPTMRELFDNSDLELTVAGTADAVLMVEAGASELPEDLVLEAIMTGHRAMQPLIQAQEELRRLAGKPKQETAPPPVDEALKKKLQKRLGKELEAAIYNPDKGGREDATRDLRKAVIAEFAESGADPKEVGKLFESLEKELVRDQILKKGRRPDGRSTKDIRPISIEVGVLPRAHGSGLFTRGQTQVLSVATLGTDADEQTIDSIGLDEPKRYIHHYNFPPFSVGEARPLRGTSRRDIGHGALAERALMAVLPDEQKFPYVIRVVSDTLSSNGSTSMASTCGSSLALLDAGVPIKAPVGGVAMGLVTADGTAKGKYAILTDIQGVEDALGDMDFKVTGTREGITAIQMDIKVAGLTEEILKNALAQAREGRLFILDKMEAVIKAPRAEVSVHAPRITSIKINSDKIRDIIGPGGKMIRKITEETKTSIDIQDDGTVNIGSNNAENTQKAIDWIKSLTREVEAGEIYTGKVTRIMPFGAFVEILPGKEGLVHISELANYRVPTVEDVVNIGDEIQVLVTEIDRQGRVNLSRRALLEPSENGHDEDGAERNGDMNQGERRPRPFNERRGRDGDRGDRGGRGGGYGGRDRDRGPRRESSGDNRDREREGSNGTREPARDAEPAAEPARRPRRESSGDRPRGSATGRRASLRSPTPEE
ncbi:MAG: polyribonucleotide nucleotidyltransferase [Chloroflexi bacterium]|nr:polyribonucleotide nucleotidyltransferase [Chloroflexota bacterium]MBV9895135.1 polyribonucleotide nucleotidyltransferase [Chloroflexota bacterium]